MTKIQLLKDTIFDAVLDVFVYGRENDDELTEKDMKELLTELTRDQLKQFFAEAVDEVLNDEHA